MAAKPTKPGAKVHVARCGKARRRCRRRIEGPRRARLLRALRCGFSSPGPNPTTRAPPRRCARWATRSLLAPLLRIEAVANADLGPPPWSGVLITSANGARALAGHPRRGELLALPVLAVGGSSADAARTAGFTDVSSADGDASDLARLAAERFSGARHAVALSRRRGPQRRIVGARASPPHRRGLSRARAATSLPSAQGGIDGVLHFSRRSVEAYLACGGAVGGSPHIIACRRGPPNRSGPPAPRASRSRRGRTRRACFLWSRQSLDRIV